MHKYHAKRSCKYSMKGKECLFEQCQRLSHENLIDGMEENNLYLMRNILFAFAFAFD